MTKATISKNNTTVNIKQLMGLLDTSNLIESLDSNNLTNSQILGASALKDELDEKVDVETGKGLSTNDFNNDYKTKLDNIESGANNYTHHTQGAITGKPTGNANPDFGESVTVSQINVDTEGHVTGATDRTITIPSTTANFTSNSIKNDGLMSSDDKKKLDDISEEANKVTYTQTVQSNATGAYKIGSIQIDNGNAVDIYGVDTNTQITVDNALSNSSTNPVQNQVVNTAISGLDSRVSLLESNSLSISVLGANEDLPQSGNVHTLYFKPNNGSSPNLYDEYAWTGSAFEKVGYKEIDLSSYVQISRLDEYVGMEIDSNGDLSLIFTTPNA